MMLGVAGRRPKYWWDLGQSIDSDLGGLLGTHVRNSNILRTNPYTGLIETLANNIPVHELVGGHLALRDEPEGTNLIHFSHELGNVASGGWWTNQNLTSVTANGMLAPDGNVAADGLVANANDATHYLLTPFIAGIAQNDKVALTIFGKIGDENWAVLKIAFYDAGDVVGDVCEYFFDLSSGTIGSKDEGVNGTIHSYIIESAANGYYRIGFIVSSADGDVAKIKASFGSAHADNDDDFAGDTTTVNTWLWGADLKKQAYFGSYVPTSGATASRATESGYPLWTLPAGLFDAAGTASVWVRFGYAYDDMPVNTVNKGIISSADSGASVMKVERQAGGNGVIATWDGATGGATSALNFTANTWYKFVVKWSSTTLKMRVGYDSGVGIVWGTEVAFDGSYTLGTNLRLAYGLFGPMWLRDLRLYDIVLTNTMINATGSPP